MGQGVTTFTNSLTFQAGMNGEQFLDSFFKSKGWRVEPTSTRQERELYAGDRIFLKDGAAYYIEYKSDERAHTTRNVFLETISVDIPESYKLGWVHTCRADYIIYLLPLDKIILVFIPEILRLNIEYLKKKFKTKMTHCDLNQGYNTHGVIVPLEYAKENLATQVIEW